jgi:glycosyltransferase involved in cell wall biosynthesis
VNDADLPWIVIPAFNEGPVIGDVVAGVRARYRHVVVIDDCSRDETGDLAFQAGAIVLRHAVNLGQGAALATGIRYALSQGAEYIVTFDADGQHRVDDIPVLLNRQRETGAEVVVGSRFLGTAQRMPPLRRMVLKLAVLFMRLTSGVPMSDAHNGLRLLTRTAAERIRIRQNRMAHASEIVEQIGSLGLSQSEAPVTIEYTEYSLNKGQKLVNAIDIVWATFLARLYK